MLEDMSVAELKERLVRCKLRAAAETAENAARIASERKDRAALVNEKLANIERIRSIAGSRARGEGRYPRRNAPPRTSRSREEREEAEVLQKRLDAKRLERTRLAEEKARADAEYEFKQRRIMGANEEVRLHRKEHELARAKDRKEYEMSRRIETEARFAAATARRDARTRATHELERANYERRTTPNTTPTSLGSRVKG